MAEARRTAVVAIGGNSLIKDKEHQSVRDQYIAAGETCWHIASMIKDGWEVAITHGNGPQVGFILRRSELSAHELHQVPLDVAGADTQGAIGYIQYFSDIPALLVGFHVAGATAVWSATLMLLLGMYEHEPRPATTTSTWCCTGFREIRPTFRASPLRAPQ